MFFFVFFCNLFIFKEKQRQIQIHKKQHMIYIYNFTDKRHLIYKNKHFASLHCNFKHQGQIQMATTFYTYILFVQRIRNLWLSFACRKLVTSDLVWVSVKYHCKKTDRCGCEKLTEYISLMNKPHVINFSHEL